MPGTFEHVRESLKGLQVEPDLAITDDFLHALSSEVDEINAEIKRLEGALPDLKTRMDQLWVDSKEYEYELVSVFMHRGEFQLFLASTSRSQQGFS
jgi:ubiquitin carboxyl-terminal hydrolase 25/28